MRSLISYASAAVYCGQVQLLEERMREYYSCSATYYQDIDFALDSWTDSQEFIHRDIIKRCTVRRVCEVGCGRAGILRAQMIPESIYAGCDFSETLVQSNQRDFPRANFQVIPNSVTLPFGDGAFDFVFSVFVLEHVVQPKRFIRELTRVCAPGGTIAVLCPDFYGRRNITSQVMGSSGQSGREKLRNGKYWEALLTLMLSRLAMPLYLRMRLRNASDEPVYLMNTRPACFEHNFYPDADAVYVTHRGEIDKTFSMFGFQSGDITIPEAVQQLAVERQLIYAVYRGAED
jgi:ubiquinone/menaquinone biosynthesis C-methylase UbiE